MNMEASSLVKEEFIKALFAEDELGCVVRAHLYIEAQINRYIEITVFNPSHVSKLKLNYAGKVDLICCLGFDPKFINSLKCIGTLRNKFAHSLASALSMTEVSTLFNSLPRLGNNRFTTPLGSSVKRPKWTLFHSHMRNYHQSYSSQLLHYVWNGFAFRRVK
jgi:hypothetical protein